MIRLRIIAAYIISIIALIIIALLACCEILWELIKAPFKNRNHEYHNHETDRE